MRKPCWQPTTSWISARAPACTGAMLCAPAQPRRSWPVKTPSPASTLERQKEIPVPAQRRPGNGEKLVIRGARENNLKNVDVTIPLGTLDMWSPAFPARARVSLINEILYKHLAAELNGAKYPPRRAIDAHRWAGASGQGHQHRPVAPSAARPRSNPATYTGVFNDIRELFAQTQDAKMRGLYVRPLFLQRQGRPVRGLRGRRHRQDRDALPAGYLCPLRGLQGQAVQPGDAGGQIQGQEHLRCAGDDGGGGTGFL